jgi:cation diffusion facilitator family transporter
MAKGHASSVRVVLAALAGNAGISVAKFVAAGLTGSPSMFAEAVHSVADTGNQALLLLGMALSKKRDPVKYPLGRHQERYFWAFVVALMLFFAGGVNAIWEGVHKLRAGHAEPGSPVPSLVVLALSLVLEAASFTVAWREMQKTRAGRGLGQVLFGGKDPTITLVLLEDAGALVGLLFATAGVVGSWLTKSMAADAIASIAIGTLLCTIGAALARDTHSLLLGEAASPEVQRRALELSEATPGVEKVTQMLTMHLGPETILLALKVRFRPGMAVEELERVTDELEARVRGELPQMRKIFVEADGDYVEALDAAARVRASRG